MRNASISDNIASFIASDCGTVIAQRRWFHEHPECAFQEKLTREQIASLLTDMGYTVHEVAGGIVADISESGSSHIAVRADIDALPVTEVDDGRPYRSLHEGRMHACGHDAHVATALGVARFFAQPERAAYAPRFIFQPAEETGAGALPMLKEGVLDSITSVIGVHFWCPLNVGDIVVQEGPLFGNVDTFTINVQGKGGHGGLPHMTVDPIVASAGIINAVQSIVSRSIAPSDDGVVTIGNIHGGTASNVIPDAVVMDGTIRSFAATVQDCMITRLKEMAKLTGKAYGCKVTCTVHRDLPAVINASHESTVLKGVVEMMPNASLHTVAPITVGDDMSYFINAASGCYALIGCGNASMTNREHHQSHFDIDEKALSVASEFLIRSVLQLETIPLEVKP